ncbi:MAG: TonB-dependent receptor plug domain-containing protein [Flavobacteriaceae bacterium]|nr:TonB-dependent receptor plug domain-containing protein [Flavobacteriaceae bacterium]
MKQLLLFAFAISSSLLWGQDLTGKVTDANDNPLTDILVYLDTIKVDTRINKRGFFKVKVAEGTENINIYSPQYGLLTTPYQGEEKMTFVFLKKEEVAQVDPSDFNDLVKGGMVESSAEIDLENNKEIVGFNNIYEYLRGRVPGVRVDGNNRIVIRGVKSVTGNSAPLFVVDGMPVQSLDFVDVNQIKDVEVIKDGASIYGSRGANGVLIISLKK